MLYMTIPAIGSFPKIDIETSDLELLRKSNDLIKQKLSIEEKFDFVIGNYRELQTIILTKALDSSLYQIDGVKSLFNDSRDINRKLFNFLTSATLYFDHLKTIRKKEPDIFSSIKNSIDKKMTESFSFKLLESLRDHMQHYDISTWSSNGLSRVGNTDNASIFFYTRIVLNVKNFINDSKIKRLFPEFDLDDKNIELNDIIAEYLDDIIDINNEIRILFTDKFLAAESCIDGWISRYEELWPVMKDDWQKILGISELVGKGFVFEFSRNSLDILEELVKRNSSYSSFRKRIISNVSEVQIKMLKK